MSDSRDLLILSAAAKELEPAVSPLVSQGASARYVAGAYRFVAAFAAQPADIAVLDLEGLERRDLEILRVIREIRPEVGIVALVALEQRALASATLGEGADLYLLKPVAAAELQAAIDRSERMRRAPAEPEGRREGGEGGALELALAVAHEINNPLTTISGWLQMLSEDREDDEQLAGVLASLREETDRIAEAVSQLLLFAQQEPPHREPMDLKHVIEQLSRAHSADCEEKGIHFITHISRQLPAVTADEKQILHACEGIVLDAEAALGRGGHIEVSCRPSNGGVEILFADDGATMAPDRLREVFRPFRRGRSPNGNRVPLSVCYGIIRSHGGRIEAKSDAATGTRFKVWLPSVQSRQEG